MDYKEIVKNIANLVGIQLEDEHFLKTILEDDTILYSENELDLGMKVFTDVEMTKVLEDGNYVTKDGTKFEIIDGLLGVIDKIKTEEIQKRLEEERIAAEEEAKKDKFVQTELVDGVILYTAEDELVIDVAIFTDEALTEAVEDGEYVTVDGTILVVVEGKLTEIRTVIEQNEKLKSIIDEMNKESELVKSELVDSKSEVEELTTTNETLKKTNLSLAKKINEKPAVESINFNGKEEEENIELTKEEKNQNTQKLMDTFKDIKKMNLSHF